MRWSRRAGAVPASFVRALARAIAAWKQPTRGEVAQQSRWAKLPDMVERASDLVALYQLSYALFLPAFQRELLAPAAQAAVEDGLSVAMRSRLAAEIEGRSALAAISVLEQRLFLGERLLRDTDAASMAASIEVRLPLVDEGVRHAAYAMPERERYAPIGTKPALRKAGLAGLDPALFDRPKAGFVLPFDRWLKARLGQAIHDTMSDPVLVAPTGLHPPAVARLWRAYRDGAPGIYWTRIWAIYVFIRWCHRHGVAAA
jgi:asparagine synthase (glutamine-hydrolysing)